MFNYSFWADEAYISGIASALITGKHSILQAFNALSYQKLYILTIALFFKIFGVSEFSARLPSMIIFLIGIIIIFLLAKKLSNVYGGLASAFLYTFSHLNLAYATMARPYIILETITLIILYLLTQKKINHFMIIILCTIAMLLHSIGVLLWILYFIYLVLKFKSLKVLKLKQTNLQTFQLFNLGTLKPFNLLTFFTLAIIGYIFILPIALSSIGGGLLPYNNSYQVIKLLAYRYTFVSICALFGYVWLFKKHKTLSIAVLIYSVVVLFMAMFRAYIFNIRYVLPLFGILFLYSGIFFAKIGEKYFPKKIWIVPLIVAILFVRLPKSYYNPNIDKYGDIQIANYKDFYSQLKKRFPNYKKLYVVNDTIDVEYWYFGRSSNTYFMKFTQKGTLANFKKTIKNHPQGLLIMEDWQSLLPEDVKQYAKKNLKLEFRVESLKEAPDDPWPLALYSWGMGPKVRKF